MRFRLLPYTIGGQWVTAITIVCLIIAPFGCQTADLFTGLGTLVGSSSNSNDPYGLLINSDPDSGVLGGVRLPDGWSVFVYGTFESDTSPPDITGAGIRDPNGQEAGITFENGRPKHAEAFDGSTADFTYEQADLERLKGYVDLYFAETGATERIEFDIDLTQAAADIAQAAAQLAGLTISDQDPPANNTASKRPAAPAGADKLARKTVTVVFVPVFAAALALVGYTMVWVMVQVMSAVMIAMTAALVAVTHAMVIAMFSPFIIMGDILRLAVVKPRHLIRFSALPPGIVFRPRCCR